MRVRNRQNFAAGAFFTAFGMACAILARSYSMGTSDDIGPGYFPFWIAVLLTLLGSAVCLSSLAPQAQETTIDKLDWKSTLWIVGSATLFAFLLEYLGAVFSTMILVLISSMGSHEHSLKGSIVSSVILALLVYLIFVKGLGLPFPAWPTIFAR